MLDPIRSLGGPTTKREIHRKLQDRTAFQESEHLTDPLALLEEYGWILTERDVKSLIVRLYRHGHADNTDNETPTPWVGPVLSVLSGFPEEMESDDPPPSLRPRRLDLTGTDEDWEVF